MNDGKFLVFAIIGLLVIPLDAMAYLDPGTGSALLQGVLGALAAVVVVLKLYWHRLLRMLGFRDSSAETSAKSNQDSSES